MRTARDGETVGANRRARDRSEGPPTHEGIESALGPTAALPTRVGHLSPPARRAVEEFGRRERIVLEETATGHGPSGVTRSGRAADHGVSSGAEGPSMTLSGRTRAASRESRDAGGDARVGVSRQMIARSLDSLDRSRALSGALCCWRAPRAALRCQWPMYAPSGSALEIHARGRGRGRAAGIRGGT